MTAIKPTDSVLRDKIDSDGYNSTLNEINGKYTEMDKFIGNLESDIQSVKDFIAQNNNSVNHQLEEIKRLTKNIYDICNENKELENEKQEYKDLINSSECIEIANKLSEIKKVKENLKFFLSKKGIFVR